MGIYFNQAFVDSFERADDTPWLPKDGIYLLFDFVHILKSIRNNWITEKTQELQMEILFTLQNGVTA